MLAAGIAAGTDLTMRQEVVKAESADRPRDEDVEAPLDEDVDAFCVC